MGRESLAHEYWKRFYARLFEQQGYRVFLEAPRKRGRVDVLAVKGPERVAIEVETGKSDVIANVKNDLLSKFDQLLVVATKEKSMAKVERDLAQARLLVPNRVLVLLAGDAMASGSTIATRIFPTVIDDYMSSRSAS